MHRVPESAVVQHRGAHLNEPIGGGGAPPFLETAFRAGIHQPVQRGQRQVGAHRGAGIRPTRTDHRIDRLDHTQPGQDAPSGGHVPKRQMPGPLRHDRRLPGLQQRSDLSRRPQIPLRDHLGLALHPRHLPQVPVRLPADHLLVQARHTFGHRLIQDPIPEDTPGNGSSTHPGQTSHRIKIELARKLGLAEGQLVGGWRSAAVAGRPPGVAGTRSVASGCSCALTLSAHRFL